MNNKKATKRALLTSITALVMCVVMLAGTTFAWFTDTATANVNKIQAGNLDVALYYKDGNDWKDAEGKTLDFVKSADSKDETILWEPGCTYELPQLKIVNKGNLALKYKVMFKAVSTDEESLKLAKVLDVTMDGTVRGTLNDVLTSADEDGYAHGTLLGNSETDPIELSVKMRETAGNDYQGLSIGGIAVTVLATQLNSEYDSTTKDYDKDANYPTYVAPVSADTTGNLTVTKISGESAATATVSNNQTIGETTDVMTVTYPSGTVVTVSGAKTGDTRVSATQSLTYKGSTLSTTATENNITINATSQAAAQYDLVLPVDTTNTELVTVTIQYTPGLSGVKIYHSGELLTSTANENGETAEYNADSGVITLKLKHASPIDIIYDQVIKPTTVTTAEELTNALTDKGIATIVLGNDIDLISATANVTRTVTLDLNGKELKSTGTAISVTSGTLTLTGDGTVTGSTCVSVTDGGKAVLERGTYTAEDTAVCVVGNGSEVTINASTLNANSGDGKSVYAENGGIAYAKGSFKFNGCPVAQNGGMINLGGITITN